MRPCGRIYELQPTKAEVWMKPVMGDRPGAGYVSKYTDEVLEALEMTDNDVLNLAKEWETVSGFDVLEVLASIATVVITARSGNPRWGAMAMRKQ